ATGHIGSMVFVPSGADTEEVAVRVVTATRGKAPEACGASSLAGCIVARRVLHFVPHEILELPVVMRNSCEGVMCAAGATCVAGSCVGAEVPDPTACTSSAGCPEQALE